jgi:hypothetical protein
VAESAHQALAASVFLLAGYVYIRTSYYRRFSAEHLRTDRFALHILGYALVFAVIGAALAEGIPSWTPKSFAPAENDLRVVGITATTVNALVLAALLGMLNNVWVLLKMRDDFAVLSVSGRPYLSRLRIAATALYIRKSNDAMLRSLFRALLRRKQIMITLKSHKVYVGQPLFQPDIDPSTVFTSLRIIPFASGSRDDKTKKVTLSTQYSELANDLKEIPGNAKNPDKADPFLSTKFTLTVRPGVTAPIDIEDIGIVISWCEVESLSLFDENIYNWFQAQPPPPRQTSTDRPLSILYVERQ